MAAGHDSRHRLEFGGSPVGTEFDGKLSFDLIDRIPVFTASHTFSARTARQIRYALVSTWGPERPFYQRYQWVVIDVRMVDGWEEGVPEFLAKLRDRLRGLGGDLVVVAYEASALPEEFLTAESPEAAVALINERRAAARTAALQR